jgi:hypothetical protein
MAENFRIIDGDELFRNPNREISNADNTLYWCIGAFALLIYSGVLIIVSYNAGKERVMPGIPEGLKPIQDDLNGKKR